MGTILTGVVGSTAYGLAREGSDVDRLGVFIAPTMQVAGLDWHSSRETRSGGDGDHVEHEVGKYLRLALKANPTVTELLWLPEHEVCTAEGRVLLDLRESLLSTGTVAPAYLGYARSQVTRLTNRTDGTFSSDTRNRTVKHARHMLRLLTQARDLLLTGTLTVRVVDPERYFAFDTMTVEQMLAVYEQALAEAERAIARSVLPAEPDRPKVAQALEVMRRARDLADVPAWQPRVSLDRAAAERVRALASLDTPTLRHPALP